jgi:Ca2+-transporting ATPase
MNGNSVAPAAAREDWHRLEPGEVALRLDTRTDSGLTQDEAIERSAACGLNELAEAHRRAPLVTFLAQFGDFMIVVLLAAAIVAGIIGDPIDAVAILVIVLLNAVIGFVQEYRAERAIAALKRMAAPTAQVVRGGEIRALAARELVPGDIVLLEAGNVVPADLRLLEAAQLKVEEAALTGESVAVEKDTAALPDERLPLGERRNMAFKGTVVASGRARGVVVATGMHTELGRIATLMSEGESNLTPLQRRLTRFGKRLALAVLAICALIFAIGVLRGEPPALMFLTAVSLAVAAIPEALPAIVTISLALGAGKMVRRQALIRRLPAVETLGSVTYVCSDKTGTLTLNRMEVQAAVAGGVVRTAREGWSTDAPWPQLFRAMALNNDTQVDSEGKALGDPTEVALLLAAREAGADKGALEAGLPREREIPFDSERKRMTTVHRDGEGWLVLVKGAPEAVVDRCERAAGSTGEVALDAGGILAQAEQMAREGLRVMAFATSHLERLPEIVDPDHVERGLVFLGLVGMMDPPRPEAADAVALCKSAGITPVMITGDHPATALAIAQRLGIVGNGGHVLTGQELAQLPDEAFAEQVRHVRVYARVDPEQKIRIVEALQAAGEFVAMTGDGVNDAPALKRADIGVAMGKGGTDVAREASHMILLDDNFATIVAAVREGRRIFDNIRKFIKYTMTSNSGEIWVLFLAPFLALPVPLLPIHILWINLVTDGLPGLALAAEPEERGLMQRPPRPPKESVFAHGMWQHMVWVGVLMGAACLITQAWATHTGNPHWQTMVFTVLTVSQLGHALAIRSERESIFTQGCFPTARSSGRCCSRSRCSSRRSTSRGSIPSSRRSRSPGTSSRSASRCPRWSSWPSKSRRRWCAAAGCTGRMRKATVRGVRAHRRGGRAGPLDGGRRPGAGGPGRGWSEGVTQS